VGKGTFDQWLRSKGKSGGQHKIPRLSNSRELVEEIVALSRENQPTSHLERSSMK
jgi:hypothetical protein